MDADGVGSAGQCHISNIPSQIPVVQFSVLVAKIGCPNIMQFNATGTYANKPTTTSTSKREIDRCIYGTQPFAKRS